MASGGARNRSGPKPNPARLDALPPEGYTGKAPEFPLPDPSPRELAVWAEVWRTPQACAWSLPSESWRIPTVGMWVRVKVRCEDPEAGAALYAQLHRFADQIGMTTAGLAEMGWRITPSAPVEQVEPKKAAPSSSRTRLKVVSGGATG